MFPICAGNENAQAGRASSSVAHPRVESQRREGLYTVNDI